MNKKIVLKITLFVIFIPIIWLLLSGKVKADASTNLKYQQSGENAAFLGSEVITKNNIEKVEIKNSLEGINETAWDVTADNSGTIKAWYTDVDGDNLYEVTIGSSTGKVKANPNSSFLFEHIGENVEASIEGLENLDTSNVTNMGCMFQCCENVIKLDVSGFDTSNVTIMEYMFSHCSNVTELDVSGFNTNNVTRMHGMFNYCKNVTELDVSGFDTSNVTDMSWMFNACSKVTELDVGGFDTRNVTNMSFMFNSCSKVTELDVSGFNTSNVTEMGDMFSDCRNLTELDVSGFDTSNVTDMSWMFSNCRNLTELDVSGFDTSNVTDMRGMFYNCNNVTELDISGFNTSNVTDMSWMFQNCSNLTNITIPAEVTNIGDDTFFGCSNLKNIEVDENNENYCDIDGILFNKAKTVIIKYPAGKDGNTYNIPTGVTTIEYEAFENCNKLTNIAIPTGLTNIEDYAFYNCSNLTNIIIPLEVTNIGNGAFFGCSNLKNIEVDENNENYCDIDGILFNKAKTVIIKYPAGKDGNTYNIPTGVTTIEYEAFEGCNKLTNIAIPTGLTNIENYAFYNCSNLTNIIIPNSVNQIGFEVFTGCNNITIICKPGTYAAEYARVNNIKTSPVALNVTYSTTAPTKENVIVTITSNEEIQAVEEWTLSQNRKTLTKTYTQNGNETIIIKDLAGNEASAEIIVNNIDKTAPTVNVTYNTTAPTKENVIVTITSNEEIQAVEEWTLSQNRKTLTKTYTQNGNETIIIKDLAGNETIVNVEVNNIKTGVPGDINNDDKVTITDLLLLKRATVKLMTLTEEQQENADLNHDGKITATDLLKLKRMIVKLDN